MINLLDEYLIKKRYKNKSTKGQLQIKAIKNVLFQTEDFPFFIFLFCFQKFYIIYFIKIIFVYENEYKKKRIYCVLPAHEMTFRWIHTNVYSNFCPN